jgi:putative restriction endonuclease
MCGKIDHYLQVFSKLRTDKNKKRWTVTTCYRAPHKPFLLLSILDQIASGTIVRNCIEPSFELAELFTSYWNRIMPMGSSGSMSYPFYHLDSSGFWLLVSQPDIPHERGRTISSVKRLRELYLGAKFSDDLYSLLLVEYSREKLRDVLIRTYFSPENQNILREMAYINKEAAQYGSALLVAESKVAYIPSNEPDNNIQLKVRDQGFRKAIVKLYKHRCALCGIRMLTPEGHTIVEAAHIIPWSKSHNDKPQNGMALCRLCHWSFDEGLMGIGKEYEVLISSAVRQDENYPGHMETLSGRVIFKPSSKKYWPDQNNLEQHRKKTFRN